MVGGVRGQRVIVEVVVHIGQHSGLRCHLFDPAQGLGQVAVGWMRVAAQRVDDPAAQALEVGPDVIGDLRHIGQIGHIIDAEAKRIHPAVVHQKGREAERATGPVDRHVAVNMVHLEDRRVGRSGGLDEHIAETVQQRLPRGRVGPDRQTLAHVDHDHSQVIQPVHMIGVGVGIKHRVQPSDARIQQLAAHIGGGVDQHRCRARIRDPLDHDGASASRVLGVGRIAGPPVPAKARHPARRAAAQDGDLHLGHQAAS